MVTQGAFEGPPAPAAFGEPFSPAAAELFGAASLWMDAAAQVKNNDFKSA